MILVTGAYGFIGSRFVKYLNTKGISDILVCDFLNNGHQFLNLNGCEYRSFVTPGQVKETLKTNPFEQVFHFGAISDTTCWDGELMMSRNFQFTVDLVKTCIHHNIPISYSSSASVYGNGQGPLNLYAYSKWLIDKQVIELNSKYVQGFRYFNVYSNDDSEWHKGNQASPFYKFKKQAIETGRIEIFEGSENFKRDFIHVDKVCEIQYEMSNRVAHGIFDVGMGTQMSFLDVAEQVAEQTNATIITIPFPQHLKNHYQTNTIANMSYL